jgi:hypothetical protein
MVISPLIFQLSLRIKKHVKEGNVWELHLHSLSPIHVSRTDFPVFIYSLHINNIHVIFVRKTALHSTLSCVQFFCYVTVLQKTSAYESVVQESLSKSLRSATPVDEVLFSYDIPRKTFNMLELNSDSQYSASCCSHTLVWLIDTHNAKLFTRAVLTSSEYCFRVIYFKTQKNAESYITLPVHNARLFSLSLADICLCANYALSHSILPICHWWHQGREVSFCKSEVCVSTSRWSSSSWSHL